MNADTFYIAKPNGEEAVLGTGDIPNIQCTEISDGIVHSPYQLNNSAEFSCNVDYVNWDMLNNFCAPTMPADNFTLTHNLPIMIQARWHKKARIRKKWLKRFGMKPDVVHCVATANVVNYNTEGFDVEVSDVEYILRPDQKRRDLMFEWEGDV